MNLFQVTKKQPSSGLELKTFTGNPVTFTPTYSEALPAPFNSINLKATIVAKGGGGTPSTPIPIVGYSEVNLNRCGKNLWTFENSYSRESMGYLINNQPFFIKKGTYTFSYKTAKTSGAIAFSVKDSNGDSLATINILNGTNKGSFTLNEDGYMLAFYTNEGGTFEDFQVEIGSQATDFEPYNSQTITLALGQTVYGGKLYFDDGWKCEVTHVVAILNGTENISVNNSGTSNWYYNFPDILTGKAAKNSTTDISSHYPRASITNGNTQQGFTVNDVWLRIRWETEGTIENFKNWLSNNNVTIRYELATPFTIDLSGSDMLDAVVGKNNVFSDCGGDVEVQCLI